MSFPNEKTTRQPLLPVPSASVQVKKNSAYRKLFLVLVGLVSLGYFAFSNDVVQLLDGLLSEHNTLPPISKSAALCAQSEILVPTSNVTDTHADAFKNRYVSWMSGAVQIPTECFDVMGPVETAPEWKVFGEFHDYLEASFPLVHKTFTRTKVNTWGLAYELEGTDPSKKPIMFMGHQDVVPVEPSTIGAWTYPPFSGHYDGEYIWGRGSSDDLPVLIGILASLEVMLEDGFKPSRGIVMSFGFDEEAGGRVGALHLGKYLLDKYGKDSMLMIVDEGYGLTERYGTMFAEPAIAEKGYLDVEVTVATAGGHSSVPPAHTGIGLLAQAIVDLEAHPVPTKLTRQNAHYEAWFCYAKTGGLEPKVAKLLQASAKSDKALKKFAKCLFEAGGSAKAYITTTRAIDIVRGGVKVNALPETATAVVNHRINADSSVLELQQQMESVLAPMAKEFDLSFLSFGRNVSGSSGSKGLLSLSEAFNSSLEPAPVTPHDVSNPEWNLLSGSAKAVYASRPGAGKDTDLIMAPNVALGNTDTKRMWPLSRAIYRFGYAVTAGSAGVHTVDEHSSVYQGLEMVRFFQTLILNAENHQD